ncbi:carbon-nitrogen hydrolase family protein [Motiliproteus sp. MSK22-1]|uniref:carbon-nitrogen hydrolase family protein n=1 Tax=Motiliproteus sp. MSK22-1 TaxID=1897630 RepID=UPI000976AA99|nr:carbon-nitrogen hydrolase family protein [Motiliproteus sp. MSK22-1]OMH29471.1 nitrilase [Motiliproteus sp. MSK22-1]
MIYSTYIKASAPEKGEGIRLAIYQGKGPAGTEQAIGHNFETLIQAVDAAKRFDAQLISFPELFISGYDLTPETGHDLAMEVDGPWMRKVAEVAKEKEIAIICPYPEKAQVAGETRFYDAMALFDRDGRLLKNYRKTHLWGPDERKVWSFGYVYPEEGEPYTVSLVNGFPVGVLNCYEGEFFELARILALKGAKLVVIPTAADEWATLSDGSRTKKPYPDISKTLLPSHAYENEMFIAYSNHCNEETVDGKVQASYLGNSMVADPHGQMVVAARNEETLLVADCIPGDYGPTHPENTHYLKDRRPELYKELVATEVAYAGGFGYPEKPE